MNLIELFKQLKTKLKCDDKKDPSESQLANSEYF